MSASPAATPPTTTRNSSCSGSDSTSLRGRSEREGESSTTRSRSSSSSNRSSSNDSATRPINTAESTERFRLARTHGADDGSDQLAALKCGGVCYGLRRATAGVVVAALRYVGMFFDVRCYHKEKFTENVIERKKDGVGVITATNHASIVDDPFLFNYLVPFKTFFDLHALRWGWCTAEVCFPKRNTVTDFVWETGKIFPVYRGEGIRQKAVDQAIGHLSRGEWFHIFPEGRLAYPELWKPNTIGPLKWGVGRLVVDTYRRTGQAPKVVPFVHRGMHINLPRHEEPWVIPIPRQPVRILVGDPIDFQETLDAHKRYCELNNGWGDPFPLPDEDMYEKVTSEIRRHMLDLQLELDQIIIKEEGENSPCLSNTYLYENALGSAWPSSLNSNLTRDVPSSSLSQEQPHTMSSKTESYMAEKNPTSAAVSSRETRQTAALSPQSLPPSPKQNS